MAKEYILAYADTLITYPTIRAAVIAAGTRRADKKMEVYLLTRVRVLAKPRRPTISEGELA